MGEEDRRSEIFKRCMRDAGYGVIPEVARGKEIGSGLPQMRISDPIQWDNSEWVVTEHGAIYPWQYGHLGNVPIYVRKNGRWVSYFNRKKIVSLPDVFEQEYLKTKREGGGLHKMALTLEGRGEAMQELVAGINKMGDERFWRFYNWWIENKESELVPWLD